ncbi:unnamed protein product [Auanema sp. JU1783]|nr:unnamed protein product [Auanema sp. JU1783]
MAAGWKKFTGQSQYPELTSNSEGSAFTYGSKQNRNFRMSWLQGRRDEHKENLIMGWISRLTNEDLSCGFEENLEKLHDGKILCRFLNRLRPNSLVRPINEKPALFSANENISTFLDSLKRFGLTDDDLFPSSDLLEKRDLAGLIATLTKLQMIL